MNLDQKTRIFVHYLFCSVKAGDVTIIMQSIDGNTGCVTSLGSAVSLPIEECKLILKDINTITKRDALKCAELANLPSALCKNWEIQHNYFGQTVFSWPGNDMNFRNMIIFKEESLNWQQVDYLRSQGYAIGIPQDIFIIEKI